MRNKNPAKIYITRINQSRVEPDYTCSMRLSMGRNTMKTLAELAEDYKIQADCIKTQIDAMPEHTDDYKLKRKRAVLWDMYDEATENYYRLKNYYKK